MLAFLDRYADLFALSPEERQRRLADVYAADVRFRDPLYRAEGLPALRAYFASLDEQTREMVFRTMDRAVTGDGAFVRWELVLALKQGPKEPIVVEGTSFLRFRDERIVEQIDYYDAGAMVYEHVPVLRGLIRGIKGWIGKAAEKASRRWILEENGGR